MRVIACSARIASTGDRIRRRNLWPACRLPHDNWPAVPFTDADRYTEGHRLAWQAPSKGPLTRHCPADCHVSRECESQTGGGRTQLTLPCATSTQKSLNQSHDSASVVEAFRCNDRSRVLQVRIGRHGSEEILCAGDWHASIIRRKEMSIAACRLGEPVVTRVFGRHANCLA